VGADRIWELTHFVTLVNLLGHGPFTIRSIMSSWLDQSTATGCDFLFEGGGLGSEGTVGLETSEIHGYPAAAIAGDWLRRLGNLVLES
jgi:hypothetical protein